MEPTPLLGDFLVPVRLNKYKTIQDLVETILVKETDLLIEYFSFTGIDPYCDVTLLAKADITFYYDKLDIMEQLALTSILTDFFSAKSSDMQVWIGLRYLSEVARMIRFYLINLECTKTTKKPWSRLLMWSLISPFMKTILRREFARMIIAFKEIKMAESKISVVDLKDRAIQITAEFAAAEIPAPRI